MQKGRKASKTHSYQDYFDLPQDDRDACTLPAGDSDSEQMPCDNNNPPKSDETRKCRDDSSALRVSEEKDSALEPRSLEALDEPADYYKRFEGEPGHQQSQPKSRQVIRVPSASIYDKKCSDKLLPISNWGVASESVFRVKRNKSQVPDYKGRPVTGARRVLAVFFASSMWRKRAKNFIPIILLLIYSAAGGLLFWLLEGRGRQHAADQERYRKELEANYTKNATLTLLVEVIEKAHAEQVNWRLETFNYSQIDALTFQIEQNSTDGKNFSGNYTYGNYSNLLENCTHACDFDVKAYVDIVTDALNHTFVATEDLIDIIHRILKNFTEIMLPLMPDKRDHSDWSIWSSIFYAGTIYTTIGYGYYTAITPAGRALTIAYALLGIPLVLYTLNQLGRLLIYGIWKCYNAFLRLTDLCRKKRYTAKGEMQNMSEFPFLIAVVITVGWTMMCSALFCTWENWDYFTSLYFFFQSLTTIGFGDIEPQHPEYLVGSFLLIIIGLALVSMCWSLLQMKLDRLLTEATQKITQKFVDIEMEGGHMSTDATAIEGEIEKITSGESRWLRTFMNDNRRKMLMNEWSQRARMSNASVQTDVKYVDECVQNVVDISENSCQTPEFMSPVHRTYVEVPLRETRKSTVTRPAPGHRVTNDEFRALLHGLRNILGECRDTLSSKDLTATTNTTTAAAASFNGVPTYAVVQKAFRANPSGSPSRRGLMKSSASQISTDVSTSMSEL